MRKTYIGTALVALMVLICFVWYSCAKEELKGSIYGTVTDYATGEPVANANVKLRPNGETTLTGSDGNYEFKDLDAGKYSLLFSKAEYADVDDDYIVELEVGKDVKRDVQMRKKIASLQITDMDGNPLDTLDFGPEETVTVMTFNLFNNGTEKLSCAATYDCEWITNVSGLEGEIPSGQTAPVTVKIDRVALVDGENTTKLYITSGNGSNEIVVKATFLGAAVITTTDPTNVTASSATVGGNITDDGGRPVLARGICYGVTQTPTIEDSHTEDGSGTGSFSHNITGLSSSTTYYARAYATNRNSTYYASNIVSFTTANGLPTVSTTDVTNVTASTAKSGGNVTNNGGFNVTARGVCWNTMGSPDLNDAHTTNGNGNGIFTSNLTNLAIGTTYHVRAYATNEKGTNYGEERSFTTPSGVVTITLSEPSNVTSQTATCSANITDDGGVAITMRGFCWGTAQYPTREGNHIDLGSGSGNFTASITNLQASTTYYVRAYAVNLAGTTYSEQRTFTTTNGLPTITTSSISNFTAVSAVSGGTVSANGGFNVTARGVCWNTLGNPDVNDNHTTNGSGNGTFTSNITGLTPGTTYHVRAYATNSMGTNYGNDISFTTSDGSINITLSNPTNIMATTASCSATINSDGGAAITERGICWSTSQYPTTSGSHASSGSGTGTYTATLSGLTPSATYYVRAYAINATGTSYSTQKSFTTNNGVPSVSLNVYSNTATSITCNSTITTSGNVPLTGRGICWSTSPNPTITSSHTNGGTASGNLTEIANGLTANTTYYLRAYATTAYGTYYSAQTTRTTDLGLASIYDVSHQWSNDSVLQVTIDISSDGGYTVTSRGICYNHTGSPTISNSCVTSGTGSGTFTVSLPINRTQGTYYIRAFATNTNGTVYGGDDMTITVTHPYNELPTFSYNGHMYKVAPDPGINMSYNQSTVYCNGLSLYGCSDWRIPTEEEMAQMCVLKDVIGGFSVYGDMWTYHQEYYVYWTSAPVSGSSTSHKVIYMHQCVSMQANDNQISSYGEVSGVDTYFFFRIRPIRLVY